MNITQKFSYLLHKSYMLFWRDLYVYQVRFKTYGINYLIIFPLLYIIAFAYLVPGANFGISASNLPATLFVGNVVLLILSMTYNLMVPLLYDLEGNRFIEYQILVFPAKLVLSCMVLLVSLFTTLMLSPFFPLTKLILSLFGVGFDTHNTSWISLFFVMLCGSLCCAAYNLFALCFVQNSSKTVHVWLRVNMPMLTLGGFWVPWFALYQLSPILGYLAYANPLLYITEGLRSAIIGNNLFIPVHICLILLCGMTVLFLFGGFYLFKRKTDHI